MRGAFAPEARCGYRNPTLSSILATQMPCRSCRSGAYVANSAWGTGSTCDSSFEWEFPSGAKLEFDCVLSVTNPGGGDSTNVAGLEFEVQSDGKPTFTPAASG
ncbi:MAG: hypothetical protein PUE42_02180 [Subdoligranulum sp.]|nr:hypothetical protein [Subdoligranulum sp.]